MERAGAYETGGLSADQRDKIVQAAGQNLQAGYTLWFGWKGTRNFRCDGLVSYAYAQAGVTIHENPGSWTTNYPRTQRDQLKKMNDGNLASGRAPFCSPISVTPSGGAFLLSMASVSDDPNGSGIDRVEFYSGDPDNIGASWLGTDDHDSDVLSVAIYPGLDTYYVSRNNDPGTNLFARIYDQAGNYATCDDNGNTVGTSDLTQTQPNINEDVTAPTIQKITAHENSDGLTGSASWSAIDDKTLPSQINYAFAVDVPFDQWDDPNVTIVGQATSASLDFSGLGSGPHTLYLAAFDQEGNIGISSGAISPGPSLSMRPDMAGGIAQGGLLDASLVWSAAYSGFSGVFNGLGDASQDVPVVVPYLQSPTMSFSLNDGDLQASPVDSVTATDPAGNGVSLTLKALCGDGTDAGAAPYCDACARHGGGPQVYGSFPTPLSSPGQYTLTATDCAGAQTVAPVLAAPMSVSTDVVDSMASFDAQTGAFTKASVVLNAYSYQGLDSMDSFQLDLSHGNGIGTLVQHIDLSGSGNQSQATLITTATAQSGGLGAFSVPPNDVLAADLLDTAGNTYRFNLSMTLGGPGLSVSFSTTTGCSGGWTCQGADFVSLGQSAGLAPALNTGQASLSSPVLDVTVSTMIPGVYLPIGPWVNPATGLVVSTYTPFAMRATVGAWTDQVLPIDTDQPLTIGTVVLKEATGGAQLYKGSVILSTTGAVSLSPDPSSAFALVSATGRYAGVSMTLATADQSAIMAGYCRQGAIDSDGNPIPGVCKGGNLQRPLLLEGVNQAVRGLVYGTSPAVYRVDLLEGGLADATVPLGLGVSLSHVNIPNGPTGGVDIGMEVGSAETEPGWTAMPPRTFVGLGGPGWPAIAPVTVTVPLLGLTGAQKSYVRVATIDPSGAVGPDLPLASPPGDTVSFQLSQPEDSLPLRFMVLAPSVLNPVTKTVGAATVLYDASQNVTLQAADPNAQPLQGLLFSALNGNTALNSPAYLLGPEGVALKPPAVVKLSYNGPPGGSQNQVVELSPGSPARLLPGQFTNYQNSAAAAPLSAINSYFGVLGPPTTNSVLVAAGTVSGPPSLGSDTTPPQTQLSESGPSAVDSFGNVLLATGAFAVLTATDPFVQGQLDSGVARTYFALNPVPTSTATAGWSLYSNPLSFSVSTRTLAYYSVDNAGNVETPRQASLFVPLSTSVDAAAQAQLLRAVALSSTAVELSWDRAGNPPGTTFVLAYGQTGNAGSCPASPPVLGQSATSFVTDVVVSGLAPGAGYQFAVCARGSGLQYPCSNSILLTTPSNGSSPQASPSFLVCGGTNSPGQASVAAVSSTTASLAWDPGGNPLGTNYTVAYGPVGANNACNSSPSSLSYTVSTSTPAAAIGGLLAHTSYAFIVCNPASQGPCAAPVGVTTAFAGTSQEPNPAFKTCGGQTAIGASGALALAADGSGNLWEVAQDNGAIELDRYDASGNLLSSLPLPNASEQGNWTVSLSSSGAALAVGSQVGSNGPGPMTAYLVDASGTVLLSTAVYNGFGLAFDSTGGRWITGAVSADGQTFSLALLKFDPAQSLLTLATTYSRGAGTDGGLGVRQDAGGDLWVVGISSNPFGTRPNQIDLGLWKFSPDGTSLLAGPFFRPGYQQEVGGANTLSAKIAISSAGVYAAASRLSNLGNQDLALVRYDFSGNLLAEKFWSAVPTADALPTGIALDASGGVLVPGSVDDGNSIRPALWNYDTSARFQSAQSASGFGQANDLAFSGSNLWLATDVSSAPYLFSGGQALAGVEGTSDDAAPPETFAVFGNPFYEAAQVYISSLTSISLLASDDLKTAGDGLGVGVAQTFYSVDGGSFAPYLGPFTLTSESSHTLRFNSVDFVGNTEPVEAVALTVDDTPPATSLLVDGLPAGSTSLVLTSTDVLGFSAFDSGSGVSSITYGINGSSLVVFSSSFSLAAGAYALSFFSADNLGHQENVKSAAVVVSSTAPSQNATTTGLALSADASGSLWEVVQDNGVFELAKFGASGGLLSTTALPGAPNNRNWSLSFDPGANALAVAGGGGGSGPFAAVYRVSPSGALLSSAAFNGTAFALDSAGGQWIVGARSSDQGETFELALWKFDPSQSLLTPATTYSRGAGLDAGLGVSLDPAGNIWVVGYSSNPAGTGANRLDLALWKFSPDGTTLLAGPYLRPGYEHDANGNFNAAIAVSSNAVFAAASRLNSQGGSDLALDAFTLGGALLIEQAWTGATPNSIAVGPSGGVAVAGSAGPQGSGTSGLWFYDAGGNFLQAQAPQTGTQDLVYSGANLWLAASASSAPYVFSGGRALSGTNVVTSSGTAVDSLPPRTTLAAGLPQVQSSSGTIIGRGTPLNLSSIDDFTAVGDAQGVGVAYQTLSVDGVFRSSFTDSTPAVGRVFSTTFTLASDADGLHVLGIFAQDILGHRESVKLSSVAVDATAPVTKLEAAPPAFGAFVSSRTALTLAAADPVVNGVASGVAATLTQDNGGAFQTYLSSFSLVEGVHALAYRSRDNVGNIEVLRSTTVLVDATPPVTALAIGAPQFSSGSLIFVASATPFNLTSQDPVVQQVASGMRQISFRRGGDPFAAYAQPFLPALPDGIKTVDWYATDNVGNQEVVQSTSVALDDSPPQTSLSVIGGHQFPGADSSTFYASSDTRFGLPALDPLVNGVASGLAFTRYQDNGGAFQTLVSTFGLAEGGHVLAYQSQDRVQNMEVLRSTIVLMDATPPVTTFAFGSPYFQAAEGTNYISPATPVSFSAADPPLPTGQPGSGVSRIEVAVDGGPFAVYTSSLTFAEGRHTILYRAVDNVANAEQTRVIAVQSDATPPSSSLLIGAPQFQLPNILLVSSRTPFSIAAVDPIVKNVASGVKDTSFRVSDIAPSTSAFVTYVATFTMVRSDVVKVIEFFSRDNVLNTEVVKSSSVLLDSTPPEVALLSPPSCDSGICRVLKGKFPVLGTARDLHFRDYQLESASGQNAASGFALIRSGTVAVASGTLGMWDTQSLSGWQTLRLTATDLVLNASVLSLNVFVGDPGELLILGNHEVFNKPEGVAAGAGGTLYVADTNHDQIKVFSSTGGLIAAFGAAPGEREDRREGRPSSSTLRLNKPKGVAVDAAGSIFIADTNDNRVLKLSAAGQILLQLGRRDQAGGKKPGEFNKPSAVALDGAGGLYVADTENHRIQVFSPTGGFAFQFTLPRVPRSQEGDGDGEEIRSGDRGELGKPFGLAVDEAGTIYAADPPGRRALEFGRAGALLAAIPIDGRPAGVAVTQDGQCLLVSDEGGGRVLKFDRRGSQNLAFGAMGRIADNGWPPPRIVFHKPGGLALDASGNLYVADRNNSRVQEFSLPTGGPAAVLPAPSPRRDWAGDIVLREEGGRVEREDRAGAALPPNALPEDLVVTVSPPAKTGEAEGKDWRKAFEKKGLKPVSAPVEFGPSGVEFKFPVTVTLPYNPAMAELFKAPETDLKVHRWEKGDWEALDSMVDPQKRTVSARTLSFSLFQVFALPPALKAAAADQTFAFGDLMVSPKALRGGESLTIRLQAGRADAAEVEIKDGGGALVHGGRFTGPQLADLGNGRGRQFTFEHSWTPSGLAPGIYIITVTARKAGAPDIRRNGRFGLVK